MHIVKFLGQIVLVVLAVIGFAFGTSCRGKTSEMSETDPGTTPAVEEATGDAYSDTTQSPIRFTIRNPSSTELTAPLIQGGFPFARGSLTDPNELGLVGADGAPVPLQSRALGYWDDGSIKWAQVTSYAPALAGRSVRYPLPGIFSRPAPWGSTCSLHPPHG